MARASFCYSTGGGRVLGVDFGAKTGCLDCIVRLGNPKS